MPMSQTDHFMQNFLQEELQLSYQQEILKRANLTKQALLQEIERIVKMDQTLAIFSNLSAQQLAKMIYQALLKRMARKNITDRTAAIINILNEIKAQLASKKLLPPLNAVYILLISMGIALAILLVVSSLLVFPPAVVLPLMMGSIALDVLKASVTGVKFYRAPNVSRAMELSTAGIGTALVVASLLFPPLEPFVGLILGVLLIAKETVQIGLVTKKLVDLNRAVKALNPQQASPEVLTTLTHQHHAAYLTIAESLAKILISSSLIAASIALIIVFPPALPAVGITAGLSVLGWKAYKKWLSPRLLKQWDKRAAQRQTSPSTTASTAEDSTAHIFQEEIKLAKNVKTLNSNDSELNNAMEMEKLDKQASKITSKKSPASVKPSFKEEEEGGEGVSDKDRGGEGKVELPHFG